MLPVHAAPARSRLPRSAHRAPARALCLGAIAAALVAPPAQAGGPATEIDLLAGRALWHVYQRGLVITFAGEGFRKYSQEYNSPWGAPASVEGRTGRKLTARATTLRLPWLDAAGEATLVVRLRGDGAQRLSATLNGRVVKNAPVPAGWQTITARVPAGLIKPGEQSLVLTFAKAGALLHSVELVPGAEAPPADAWPAEELARSFSAGSAGKTALTGARRLVVFLELPPSARLELTTGTGGAPARFRVAVRPAKASAASGAKPLLDAEQAPATWTPRQIALDSYGRELVALELSIEGDPAAAAWAAPRITVPAGTDRARPKPMRNVIVWVSDALRADRLAVYGKTRVATPRITGEVKKVGGLVFLHSQAASPSSPPSHASIQTGVIPRVHGVGGDKGQLVPGTPMLSAVLGAAGVRAAYYGNNPFGMGRLEKAGKWHAFHQPVKEGQGPDCKPLVKLMLGYAEERARKDERFFLSSVAFDTHTPYRYHEGITEHYYKGPWDPAIGKSPDGRVLTAISSGKLAMTDARWAQLRGLYDGEVEYMDGCFGALMDGLAALKLAQETAVIVMSDHGEGFFEHGKLGHAFGHWGEVANAPLVILAPGLTPGATTVEIPVSHIDVAPTVLDLLGLPPDARMQGQSVLPLALHQGPLPPRMVPLEFGRSYALRTRGYRYIVGYAGEELLYDVDADPVEKTDLAGSRPIVLRAFRDAAGFYLARRARWTGPTWMPTAPASPGSTASAQR